MSSNYSFPSVGSDSSQPQYQEQVRRSQATNTIDSFRRPPDTVTAPRTTQPPAPSRLWSHVVSRRDKPIPPSTSSLRPTATSVSFFIPATAPQRSTEFNVYATPFTSLRYTVLNTSPSADILSSGPETISYPAYISSFAGSLILNAHTPSPWLTLSTLPPPLSLSPNISSYTAFFNAALGLELRARISELELASRYKIPLTPMIQAGNEKLFYLPVHGLAEDAPKVEIGDTLILRQLVLDPRTGEPIGMESWLGFNGQRTWSQDTQYPPGATMFRHVARVWGVDKRKEKVVVRVDGIQFTRPSEPFTCNVLFLVQPRTVEPLMRAIQDVGRQLNVSDDEQLREMAGQLEMLMRSDQPLFQYRHWLGDIIDANKKFMQVFPIADPHWLRRMLFPEPDDGTQQTELWDPDLHKITWLDNSLNYEQKKAVVTVKDRMYGTVPFLISGPPGTGKTKTLVAIALQVFHEDRQSRILICTPSDQAADILAQRLSKTLTANELFRLNTPNRNFAEVPEDLLMFCNVQDSLFFIPPLKKLLSYRIIVTTCLGADVLVQARITNRDLHTLESSVRSTLHPTLPISTNLYFHALLIDEAAQATEVEALIPLMIIAPPVLGPFPLLVMAGDHNQLPPRLCSSPSNPALRTSLFERLLARPAYADHPLSRGNSHRNPVLTKAMLPIKFPPFLNLVRNYRSHPAVLALPNHLLYNNTLLPCAEGTDCLSVCSVFPRPGVPILFAAHGGLDDCLHDDRSGWYNTSEAHRAVGYVQAIIGEGWVMQKDICVMSPFRAQVGLVRKLLRQIGLRGVDVGPVEAFQGKERGVVIFLTTRSRTRFLAEDQAGGKGVVGEPRRVNVGITRAKWGCVVVGNPWVLDVDDMWRAFMGFCWRVGAWQHDFGDDRGFVDEVDARGVNSWLPKSVGDEDISAYEKGLGVVDRGESRTGGRALGGRVDRAWASGVEAEEIVAIEDAAFH